MSARAAALVPVALAVLCGAPAHAGPPELWPLWLGDERSVAGLRVARAAGPFFEAFESQDGTRGWVLRPLLGRVERGTQARLDVLYPLAAWRRTPERWNLRLSPLVDLSGGDTAARAALPEAAAPGESQRRRWTALLAFGGRNDAGEGYFGLFPFGGVAKQRFGLERLDFWLFPLFARARHRDGFQRTYLFWPFVSWGSGAGRRLLRIWPFYGSDVAEGRHERRFALWPLVHWRREAIGSPAERRVRLLLPFYGERTSATSRARFVLGPLYMHSENDRTGAHATDWLWPLVRFAERPARGEFSGARELRLEPFYRRRTAPGQERTGVLLGALERARFEGEAETSQSWRLLWVSRFLRSQGRAEGEERVQRDLWPLFRFRERRRTGARPEGRLAVPWLLPLSGEGWDRHWLAPLTLYDGRWRGAESRSDWLWGLLRRRGGPDFAVDDLGGVLRHERGEDGTRRLRLLGLPLLP